MLSNFNKSYPKYGIDVAKINTTVTKITASDNREGLKIGNTETCLSYSDL